MSKNTGDGELKKILIDYLGTAWRAYEDGLIDPAPLSKAKTAIKKWAAQEANKAIIRFLENSDNVSRDELLAGLKAENPVIQNKLEGLQ